MPTSLRAQIALIGFLAVLLIPIGTSSLRGLTHILTCREASELGFLILVPETGPPTAINEEPRVLDRDDVDADVAAEEVCGGLRLDLGVAPTRDDRADIVVTIENRSDYGWRGSVQLEIAGTLVPVDVGQVPSGGTVSDRVELRLRRDRQVEIAGTLLVGP